MRKVKLFVDGHWFDDPFQSPCTFLKGLYNHVAEDSNVEIFIGATKLDLLEKSFRQSPRINFIKYNSHSKYFRLSIDIPRLIKKYKIDAAHYQYISPLQKNCPEIVTIHDLLFKDFPELFPASYRITKNFLFYRSAKRADLVTTVSDYSLTAIQKHFAIPSERLVKIPNGIADEYFLETKQRLPDINARYNIGDFVLCVSRIEPRKNHITLVKAFYELELWKRNLKLVLIGREDIPVVELDSYLNSLPTEARKCILKFTNIEFAELLSFYKESKLFVYPSTAEGFGIPPLEAAAMKAKVLCSNATAMGDFTFFGKDLFNPLNIEELKMKIIKKMEEKDSKENYISNVIREQYNWRNIANVFLVSLNKIV